MSTKTSKAPKTPNSSKSNLKEKNPPQKQGQKTKDTKKGKNGASFKLVIETPLGFKVNLDASEKRTIGQVKQDFLQEFTSNTEFTKHKSYSKSVIPTSHVDHLAIVLVEGENTLFLNEDSMKVENLVKHMGKRHKKNSPINLKISKFMSINPLHTGVASGGTVTVDTKWVTDVKMNVDPENGEIKPVGIKNPMMHNVCYQNSILQLFSSHMFPMRKYFANFKVPKKLAKHEGTQIIFHFQSFLRKTNEETTIDNSTFQAFLWDEYKFTPKTQQDAQEFLFEKLLVPLDAAVLLCATQKPPESYKNAKEEVEEYEAIFKEAYEKFDNDKRVIKLRKEQEELGKESEMNEKQLRELRAKKEQVHVIGQEIKGTESKKMDKLKDKLEKEEAKLVKSFRDPITGKFTTFLECKSCGKTATKKGTPFKNLQLCLDDKRVASMEDSLGLCFQKEKLERQVKCRLCGEAGQVAKYHKFTQMPDSLLVSLTRMTKDSKIKKKLDYHQTWDLNDQFKDNEISDKKAKYRLVGVCNHKGKSAKGGHYTALVKESAGTWWDCDDSKIAKISNIDKKLDDTEDPYILLYQKVD